MMEFLRLIRWQNLIIVALTMILMRYCVISPLLATTDVNMYSIAEQAKTMSLQLPWFDFIILITATLLITAGGYVINDYFDIKTDLINRGSVIVGTKVPRRQAMKWHNILNVIGVVAGFYISWRVGYFWMGAIFMLVSGLLYFYSASYKRQFLIGNIIVSILTAMVPMMVVLFEAPVLYRYYAINSSGLPDLSMIFYWVGGFALFAFLTTLTREIVKDIEDFEGDVAYGRNTLPVVLGILTSRIIAGSLVFITVVLIYLTWFFFVKDYITLIYISLAITVPLMYVLYRMFVSRSKAEFRKASNIMKLAMLTGILYSVLFRIIVTWNLYR